LSLSIFKSDSFPHSPFLLYLSTTDRCEVNRCWSFLAISFVLGTLFASSLWAQARAKIYRIGFLGPSSAVTHANRLDAIRQGLRELGYIEGKNIMIEYRYADGKVERLPELAAELMRLEVDLIITSSTPSVQAVKNASATIPIVFTSISHPIENGIVASFARPGGNATGLTILTEELTGKRLELLKEAVPTVTRIAFLSDITNPTQPLEWKESLSAAQGLRLKLHPVGVRTGPDLDRAFEAALRERVQALITIPQPLLSNHRDRIVELATKTRLPAMYFAAEFADAGGLMSYSPVYRDLWRRAATYVDKILKGANPAELPVEQPKKFELVVNLRAAKQIGLTIPATVIARADRVIR
jgi:putative ABC transport system substrate-binding protein